MKGLGINRNRHLSDSCEPSSGLPEVMYPLAPDPRSPFLLSPTIDHYGTMDSHHFPPTSPTSLPPECMLPFHNQMTNSSTFPRIHYNSEFAPTSMPGIPSATLGTSVPFGMSVGMSVGVGGTPLITSGSATISTASKINRLPANLLDQFEKQLPVQRDGFSTLQFHRSRTSKQRSESPGRIRYLVHSVQKLFAKSQSLEASIKGNLNGRAADGKRGRRSKSKDRAKTESAKRRNRSNILGLWSSEDNLDDDAGACHAPVAMMTLGRSAPESQGAPKVFPQGYNTISENTLKASKSNNDLKVQVCPPFPVPADGTGDGDGGEGGENKVVKRSSWSTLTLSQARQVCQMGSATIDKSLLKSKSCHQDLTCRYLQAGEWNNTLGRSRGSSEIPCRRMRSGSYVKAMGDQGDSEDSEGSPKPSPKMAGRRQSYLKATQQSLSEQLPSRNCLPSLQELSTNRSLDNLDCISGPPSATFPNWDEEDFSLGCNTLGKIGCITKMQDPEVRQTAVDTYQDSPFGEGNMQLATEAVDLPSATCFRSRSHSYLRAIQAGCSQDEDTASLDSDSPPPTATTVRTYSSSTTSTCITTCKRTPPPVPPRIAPKPFISVTVQSSTESAHDTYLENQERRTEAPPSAGRPVPSYPPDGPERVDAAQPSPCTTQQEPPTPSSPPKESQHDTAQSPADTLTPEEPQAEPGPKRKLSSIGIQVDCLLPVQKEETPPLTRFQSIGVQVEDSWQLNRSSSMASKPEADSDIQDDPKPAEKGVADGSTQPESEPAPNTQGSSEGGTGCQGSSYAPSSSSSSSSESLDPALDPSSLPPPDPWLESVTSNGGSGPTGDTPPVGAPACRRDGHWFLKLLQAETARMEGWCQQMEQETKDHQLAEEVLGRVRSAVGSAQLLMSQKFQQFRGLCDQNLNVDANPRPTAQDLAGFWDLLQLSIEDISMKFDELYHFKSNDWQLSDSPDKKEDKKQPPPVPKKPSKAKLAASREKGSVGGGSGGSGDPADKQRQEARKRLMAAKRAASVRQNSATESADSIEIYVPEAQTRL